MNRFRFVGRRLLQTVLLLFGIVFLVQLLLHLAPGDPARVVAGNRATPEVLQQVRERLGLDESLPAQYWIYLKNVSQGDFGASNVTHQSVGSIITQRLPVTLWLLVAGTLFSLILAIPLGVVAAANRGGARDAGVRAVTLFCIGMPMFWVGIVLILLVALPTGLFPVGGFGDTFPEHLRSIFLPALTLAIATLPLLVRSLRSSLAQVLDSDYVVAARSTGAGGLRLVRKHVLRNGIIPMISLLAVMIGYLVFGAVIIENTFALPGLGQAMVQATSSRDFPVVQGITLIFALMVVGVHLAADITIAILDPRVHIA